MSETNQRCPRCGVLIGQFASMQVHQRTGVCAARALRADLRAAGWSPSAHISNPIARNALRASKVQPRREETKYPGSEEMSEIWYPLWAMDAAHALVRESTRRSLKVVDEDDRIARSAARLLDALHADPQRRDAALATLRTSGDEAFVEYLAATGGEVLR